MYKYEGYKAGPITFVKFMTKEELLNFVTDVHNFKMRTLDGRTLESKRTYVSSYQNGKYFPARNLKICKLDCLDVLIEGAGYVRYSGYLGSGPNRELLYLFKHYGFEVEL